jgi:hypothetical protein
MLSWDLNFWHFEGGLSELSIARTDEFWSGVNGVIFQPLI